MSFFLHFFHFHFGYSLSLTWVNLSHTHIHWHLKAQVHRDMLVWEWSWGAGLLAIDGSPFVVPCNVSRLSYLLPLLLSWVLWQLPSRQCCMLKIGRKKNQGNLPGVEGNSTEECWPRSPQSEMSAQDQMVIPELPDMYVHTCMRVCLCMRMCMSVCMHTCVCVCMSEERRWLPCQTINLLPSSESTELLVFQGGKRQSFSVGFSCSLKYILWLLYLQCNYLLSTYYVPGNVIGHLGCNSEKNKISALMPPISNGHHLHASPTFLQPQLLHLWACRLKPLTLWLHPLTLPEHRILLCSCLLLRITEPSSPQHLCCQAQLIA